MSKLLKLLLSKLIFCYVEGEEEAGSDLDGDIESESETESDTDTDGEVNTEDDDEHHQEVEAKPLSRAQKEIITLRERAQKAEEQERKAMAQLEEARRNVQQPQPKPSQEQQLWEQEEAILKDPNAEPWHRYAVQFARDSRAARSEAQRMSMKAEDLADKAEFDRLAANKPKTVETYREKVESMLSDMRKNGQNAPRSELLALLVGRDMLKQQKTETKPTKQGSDLRGKTPGARSDVQSSGNRLTDAEKRAKRLENVRI